MNHFMMSSETSRTMITGVDSHHHHGTLSPHVSTPRRNRHVHDKVHHPYPGMLKKREKAKKNSLGDMSNNTAKTSYCTDSSDLSTSEDSTFQEEHSLVLGSGNGREGKNKKGSSSYQFSLFSSGDDRIDVSSCTKDAVDQPATNHKNCGQLIAKQRSRRRKPIDRKLSPKPYRDDFDDSSSYSSFQSQNTNDNENLLLWKKEEDEEDEEDSKGDSSVEASSCASQHRRHRRMNVLVVVDDVGAKAFCPQRYHRRTNVLSDVNDVVDEPTTYHNNNRGRRETHQRPRRTKPTNRRKMSS